MTNHDTGHLWHSTGDLWHMTHDTYDTMTMLTWINKWQMTMTENKIVFVFYDFWQFMTEDDFEKTLWQKTEFTHMTAWHETYDWQNNLTIDIMATYIHGHDILTYNLFRLICSIEKDLDLNTVNNNMTLWLQYWQKIIWHWNSNTYIKTKWLYDKHKLWLQTDKRLFDIMTKDIWDIDTTN